MNVVEIISEPWKNAQEYSRLVFWFVIFIIAAYAMFDGMRIAGQWIKSTAQEAL